MSQLVCDRNELPGTVVDTYDEGTCLCVVGGGPIQLSDVYHEHSAADMPKLTVLGPVGPVSILRGLFDGWDGASIVIQGASGARANATVSNSVFRGGAHLVSGIALTMASLAVENSVFTGMLGTPFIGNLASLSVINCSLTHCVQTVCAGILMTHSRAEIVSSVLDDLTTTTGTPAHVESYARAWAFHLPSCSAQTFLFPLPVLAPWLLLTATLLSQIHCCQVRMGSMAPRCFKVGT